MYPYSVNATRTAGWHIRIRIDKADTKGCLSAGWSHPSSSNIARIADALIRRCNRTCDLAAGVKRLHGLASELAVDALSEREPRAMRETLQFWLSVIFA